MSDWPFILWVIFVAACCLIGYMIAELFIAYYKAGIVARYTVFLCLIITSFCAYTFILGPSYEVHVHHYCWSGLFLCMMGHPSTIVTVLHGVFNGIMIEGASRWGFDPIWQLKSQN